MTKKRVCVIGAGVIGLSSALRIQEEINGVQVTVLAEEFTPYTTGDGSAGWIRPFLLGANPPHLTNRWCTETIQHLQKIARSEDGGRLGVYPVSGYDIAKRNREIPDWKDLVTDFREMSRKDLEQFQGYTHGFAYTTLATECKKYLPWLMQRFISAGGRCLHRKVINISELYGDFDVVVNCTGAGSRELVGDKELHPCKGQIIRVEAPWVKYFVDAEDEDLYIMLSCDTVTLGGTHDDDVPHREISPSDRKRIWEGCCQLVPALKSGRIVTEWAGFRPGRAAVRLEKEIYQIGNGKQIPMVHNYGHGGSGVTLHWGCAGDTARLVKELLNYTNVPHAKL